MKQQFDEGVLGIVGIRNNSDYVLARIRLPHSGGLVLRALERLKTRLDFS